MTMQYFLFGGSIDHNAMRSISTGLTDAINDPSTTAVYFGLSSTGGSVTEGVALYHIIRASPKPVTMHGIGNVDSIGVTILLGGNQRYATPGTRFFFHPIGSGFQGTLTVPLMRTKIQALLSDHARVGAIYKDRGEVSDAELEDLFNNEYMHDVAWAITHKFIQAQQDFMIPAGANVRNLTQ